MAKKENIEIKMKSTHSRGSISCQNGIVGQNQSHLNESICEICDKVFKTDKNGLICPDCQKIVNYLNICIDINYNPQIKLIRK